MMPPQKTGKSETSPSLIRVSSGSAVVLGLMSGFLKTKPTTVYLLTYLKDKCTANCGFCSQAKSSRSRADMLSRVVWPVFSTKNVITELATTAQRGEVKRVCIQALNYPRVTMDLLALTRSIKLQANKLPISVSCQPLNKEDMRKLAKAGIERIGIPLDAATKDVFDRVKGSCVGGPYDWDKQHCTLLEAVKVFGKGKVSTHLMVGLGETEKDMIVTVKWCIDNYIHPALFAFTPLPGTTLEHSKQPAINKYRRIQLARYFLMKGQTRFERIDFSEKGQIINFGVSQESLYSAIRSGVPFLTSGCPSCNRPYYNEKPSGPLYNFPTHPNSQEVQEISRKLLD